jgi:molybdate transport system permease protein
MRPVPIDAFFTVTVPLAKPGFLTAAILGFAHTAGESAVVLMIGGNIPGATRAVSMQIYDHVEALEYADAHPALRLVQFSASGVPLLARLTSRSAANLTLAPGLPVWVQIKAVALIG